MKQRLKTAISRSAKNPQVNAGFTIRWLGHAGFVIKTPNGQQVVFDPVKEQFDSPIDLAFRLTSGFYRKPGDWLTDNELKNLVAVMYSHIHYDHFNKADIEEIGNQPRYLTPLGMLITFQQVALTLVKWHGMQKLKLMI